MIIKNILYIIALILSVVILSCQSPDQVNQNVVDNPPVVTITGNFPNILVGDSLIVTIHATDSTLTNGKVDFKDSTVISFYNLKPELDTTIIHVYKTPGSYNITASFSDGSKNTTTQFPVVVGSNTPVITVVSNKTTVNLGEIFYVKLHVSDPTLLSGTLNFNDGTVFHFNNLNHILDTTISHVYTTSGPYTVFALFSNGYSSSTAFVMIATTNYHYYAPSFSVGMKWQFLYSFTYDEPPRGFSEKQTGVHEWVVVSYSVENQDTTFMVRQIRNDSLYYNNSNTFNIVRDTTQFPILVTSNTINFTWPLFINNKTFSVPNHAYVSQYPVEVADAYGTESKYDDHGPFSYNYAYSTIYSISEYESFSLIQFTTH